MKSKLDDKGETKNGNTTWTQLPIKELKTLETRASFKKGMVTITW